MLNCRHSIETRRNIGSQSTVVMQRSDRSNPTINIAQSDTSAPFLEEHYKTSVRNTPALSANYVEHPI